jgi:hypothetical protein
MDSRVLISRRRHLETGCAFQEERFALFFLFNVSAPAVEYPVDRLIEKYL